MAKTLSNAVDHPDYYGGADDTYEAIKVIEAWGLGFHLGNSVKYICRAGLKDGNSTLQDLKKAAWYLNRKIELVEQDQEAKEIVITADELDTTMDAAIKKMEQV